MMYLSAGCIFNTKYESTSYLLASSSVEHLASRKSRYWLALLCKEDDAQQLYSEPQVYEFL